MLTTAIASNSCGLQLLNGVKNYKTPGVFIKDFLRLTPMYGSSRYQGFTQFLYTMCPKSCGDIGTLIEDFIHEHNLGTVVHSAPGNNPVHGSKENPHDIVVWVWTVNLDGLAAYRSKIEAEEKAALAAKKEALCQKSTKPNAAGCTNSTASVNFWTLKTT